MIHKWLPVEAWFMLMMLLDELFMTIQLIQSLMYLVDLVDLSVLSKLMLIFSL